MNIHTKHGFKNQLPIQLGLVLPCNELQELFAVVTVRTGVGHQLPGPAPHPHQGVLLNRLKNTLLKHGLSPNGYEAFIWLASSLWTLLPPFFDSRILISLKVYIVSQKIGLKGGKSYNFTFFQRIETTTRSILRLFTSSVPLTKIMCWQSSFEGSFDSFGEFLCAHPIFLKPVLILTTTTKKNLI